MKNPFLKNLRFYLLAWLVIAVSHAVILYEHYHVSLLLAVADSLVYNALYAGVALDFWYAVRYLNIEKQKPAIVILAHIIAATIFIILWLIAGNYFMNLIDGGDLNKGAGAGGRGEGECAQAGDGAGVSGVDGGAALGGEGAAPHKAGAQKCAAIHDGDRACACLTDAAGADLQDAAADGGGASVVVRRIERGGASARLSEAA